MGGVKAIQARQEEWDRDHPQNFGNKLLMRTGDIVFAHFVGDGDDGDKFLEDYFAHEIPPTQQGGFRSYKYCPVQSKHDLTYECPYCKDGIKTKKRMAMWFHVYDILRTTLRQGESLPTVNYNGRNYFRQTINAPRIWDTSAWKESCLNDINFLFNTWGSLHKNMVILMAVGENLDRRYKIYGYQGDMKPFSRELAEKDSKECQPIQDWLRTQLEVPVERAPEPAPATQTAGSTSVHIYNPTEPAAAISEPVASAPAEVESSSGSGAELPTENMF